MNDQTFIRLDTTDLLILQMLYDQDHTEEGRAKPRLSLQEINAAVLSVRSVATIHARIMRLEEAGYVKNLFRKAPRCRAITATGIERLRNELYRA